MNEERKYEILPGVELPDMKSINEAASDFSVSGVNDLQIKTPKPVYTPEGVPADVATAAELAALQSLGDQVAADEARAAAESRRRMDSILSSAVQAPESLADLINYNKDKMSEEALKAAEEKIKKEEELKQAEIDREKAREERRQLQQRLLEEARDRAAAVREAEKRGIKADETLIDKAEDKSEKPAGEAAPSAPAEPAAPAEPVKPAIASDDETYDDFSEFFDDKK